MTDQKDAAWLLKEKYGGVESREYFADLRELEMGVPVAYLIGHVPFLGATIYLDSEPLIPRAETEYWLEQVIKSLSASRSHLDAPASAKRMLDLCAGSGAIGVALLKAFPNSQVDFAEIDVGHHPTIWKNVAENGISDERVVVYGGNLFEEINNLSRSDLDKFGQEQKRGYDMIVSNPPYIDPALRGRVAESVLLHEPHQALFGGTGGLELIERILREAPAHLKPGGTLYIEHEPEQTVRIHELGTTCGFASISTHKDQYGVERMTELK